MAGACLPSTHPSGWIRTPPTERDSVHTAERELPEWRGWSLFPFFPLRGWILEDGPNWATYLRDPQGFIFFKPGLGWLGFWDPRVVSQWFSFFFLLFFFFPPPLLYLFIYIFFWLANSKGWLAERLVTTSWGYSWSLNYMWCSSSPYLLCRSPSFPIVCILSNQHYIPPHELYDARQFSSSLAGWDSADCAKWIHGWSLAARASPGRRIEIKSGPGGRNMDHRQSPPYLRSRATVDLINKLQSSKNKQGQIGLALPLLLLLLLLFLSLSGNDRANRG